MIGLLHNHLRKALREGWRLARAPEAAWRTLAEDPRDVGALRREVALPLALVTPIAHLLGRSLVGVPTAAGLARNPLPTALVVVGLRFALGLALPALMAGRLAAAARAGALAADDATRWRLAVWSAAPPLAGGAIELIPSPGLALLVAALGVIEGSLLLAIGLRVVAGSPRERAARLGVTAAAPAGAAWLVGAWLVG